ncbi:hypothetical protein Trco_004830 [Trichoderma cornu-damae]|uniref:Uncharacterized protein n=1 Tax=Trichoderma cornu-damae TaxID=654480 RepID=A0A9P8TV53_9HYPO|nr:hypothetical protein Trco_004830 [Trichoderma cornu-damae]
MSVPAAPTARPFSLDSVWSRARPGCTVMYRARADGAEDDLGGVEGGVEALLADRPGDDDGRGDADGPRDEAPEPGLHLPAEGALADHLAGDGAHDAGGHAREQEGQGEDGPGPGGDARGEQPVDAEDVRGEGVRVPVQRGAGDDEDGRVDEEGKGEERQRQLRDGVLERVLDGRHGGDVEHLVAALVNVNRRRRRRHGLPRHEAVLPVVLPQPGLDDAGSEVQAVRHDGRPQDAAGLVQTLRLHDGPGGEVALEDLADAGAPDERELDAEADDDAQDQQEDEELEDAEALHGAVWAVEDEDGQDVEDGEGAAGHKGQLGDQEIVVARPQAQTYLGYVRGDDGNLCQRVEQVVEPPRQIGAARRSEIQPRDGAQLDGEALQQDGEEVAEQDDEQELEAVRGAGRDVGGVVSGIDCEPISERATDTMKPGPTNLLNVARTCLSLATGVFLGPGLDVSTELLSSPPLPSSAICALWLWLLLLPSAIFSSKETTGGETWRPMESSATTITALEVPSMPQTLEERRWSPLSRFG